jgi:hypothetical protein
MWAALSPKPLAWDGRRSTVDDFTKNPFIIGLWNAAAEETDRVNADRTIDDKLRAVSEAIASRIVDEGDDLLRVTGLKPETVRSLPNDGTPSIFLVGLFLGNRLAWKIGLQLFKGEKPGQ